MALPNWRIQIQKRLGDETWQNDYLTDDVTIEDAQDLSALILTFEEAIHSLDVAFEFIRISTTIVGDRRFRHLTINEAGTQPNTSYLPLYNTFRLDLGTSESDPARKYYRAPVREDQQENGFINGTTLTFYNDYAQNLLVATNVIDHLVTTKGNRVTSALFYDRVQMRQLHRRRRKQTNP